MSETDEGLQIEAGHGPWWAEPPVWHPTKREYFAAAALTNLRNRDWEDGSSCNWTPSEAAEWAAEAADALIRELSEGGE